MKALIVDDSMIDIKVEKKLIEHEGLVVEYVTNGKDCIERVKNEKYDIIFMDIMMPEMDGVETFQKLQLLDGFNIPVVVVTSDIESGAEEKYLNFGFKGYIAKPIQIKILREIIDKLKK